jgi:hypothetical protein
VPLQQYQHGGPKVYGIIERFNGDLSLFKPFLGILECPICDDDIATIFGRFEVEVHHTR